MGQILCQVRIPHRSLLPANDAINTFAFTGVDNVEDQATVAKGNLVTFYNALSGTQVRPLKNYWSNELNPANARIKIYDHSDPEPRVPILDSTLGLSAATPVGTLNMPGEVAVCASYSAEQESGVVAARRRGRIYLGPLNTGAGAGTGADPSRPDSQFRTDIAEACKELSSGPVGTQWAVYSRMNDAFYIIVQGYVDNAWDTQRRRGVEATSRNAWEGGLG